MASVLAFDAFNLVEQLLTQPLQIIVGDKQGAFGSYKDGQELYRRATCEKDLLVIEGAQSITICMTFLSMWIKLSKS